MCNMNIRLFFFFKGVYLFSFLAVLGLHCCSGSSLVVEGRGYPSCSAQASVVVANGSVVAAPRL